MSAWVLAATVLAIGSIGYGAQVLATQLGRFPTDVRRPGSLIKIRRSTPSSVHSPELRRLVTVISYASLDDRSAKVELQKVFQQLDAPVSPLTDAPSSRRGQPKRSKQIDDAITALERRYNL